MISSVIMAERRTLCSALHAIVQTVTAEIDVSWTLTNAPSLDLASTVSAPTILEGILAHVVRGLREKLVVLTLTTASIMTAKTALSVSMGSLVTRACVYKVREDTSAPNVTFPTAKSVTLV